MDNQKTIKVCVRFRILNEKEQKMRSANLTSLTDQQVIIKNDPHQKSVISKNKNKAYNFDHVFDITKQQIDIFNEIAVPHISQFFNAYNSTIFAYGQTASGKTYTMQGNDVLSYRGDNPFYDDPTKNGLIPRIAEAVFERAHDSENEYKFSISMLEVYNEEIYDLLEKNKTKRTIQNDGSNFIVKDLRKIEVRSAEELLELYEMGCKRRTTDSTCRNSSSSRSHSVFRLYMKKNDSLTGMCSYSVFDMVDLAGSEKYDVVDHDSSKKDQMININQSLSTLNKVISQIVKKEKPSFRESKLTMILMQSLGGNCLTTLILCASPASINIKETLSTLDFGKRAKLIKLNAKQNKQLTTKELLAENRKLKLEIERLKSQAPLNNKRNVSNNKETEKEIECLKDTIEQYKTKLTQQDEDYKVNVRRLNLKIKSYEEGFTDREKFINENKRLKNEIKRLRDKLQRTISEKNELQNEYDELLIRYQHLEIEYENLKQNNEELNEIRNKERQEYEESLNNKSDIEELIKKVLENEDSKGNKDIAKCLKDIIDSSRQNKRVIERYELRMKEIKQQHENEMKKQMDMNKQKTDILENKITDLTIDISNLNDKLNFKDSQIDTQKEEFTKEINRLQMYIQNRGGSDKSFQIQLKIDVIENDIKNLEGKRDEKKQLLEDIKIRLPSVSSDEEKVKLNEKKNNLEKEMKELKNEIHHKKKQINKLIKQKKLFANIEKGKDGGESYGNEDILSKINRRKLINDKKKGINDYLNNMENKINNIERGLDGGFDEIFQKRQNVMYIDRKQKLQKIMEETFNMVQNLTKDIEKKMETPSEVETKGKMNKIIDEFISEMEKINKMMCGELEDMLKPQYVTYYKDDPRTPAYIERKERLIHLFEQSLKEWDEKKCKIEAVNQNNELGSLLNDIMNDYKKMKEILENKMDDIFKTPPIYKYLDDERTPKYLDEKQRILQFLKSTMEELKKVNEQAKADLIEYQKEIDLLKLESSLRYKEDPDMFQKMHLLDIKKRDISKNFNDFQPGMEKIVAKHHLLHDYCERKRKGLVNDDDFDNCIKETRINYSEISNLYLKLYDNSKLVNFAIIDYLEGKIPSYKTNHTINDIFNNEDMIVEDMIYDAEFYFPSFYNHTACITDEDLTKVQKMNKENQIKNNIFKMIQIFLRRIGMNLAKKNKRISQANEEEDDDEDDDNVYECVPIDKDMNVIKDKLLLVTNFEYEYVLTEIFYYVKESNENDLHLSIMNCIIDIKNGENSVFNNQIFNGVFLEIWYPLIYDITVEDENDFENDFIPVKEKPKIYDEDTDSDDDDEDSDDDDDDEGFVSLNQTIVE